MADAVSHSSLDSAEFVVVNPDPKLKISNNGDVNELEQKLSEAVLGEEKKMSSTETSEKSENGANGGANGGMVEDCMTTSVTSMSSSMTGSFCEVTDEGTLFTGVTYLGSAMVNAPRSVMEIYRNMVILNQQTKMTIPVILSLSNNAQGTLVLLDPETRTEISGYKINKILYCARGASDSDECNCFAFTCQHGDGSGSTDMFPCHVFRCDSSALHAGKIVHTLASSFHRLPRSMSNNSQLCKDNTFKFVVMLDFREDDLRGGFSVCPYSNSTFKLRCNLEKKVNITVLQTSQNRDLKIERCFGLLLCSGKQVEHSDMQLIDIISMGNNGTDNKSYFISGQWDPTDPSFYAFNQETPKDSRIFTTIAVDLVIVGIQEPVRFLVKTKTKIYPQNERFWYFTKRVHTEEFVVTLKELENAAPSNEQQYDVVSIETTTESVKRQRSGLSLFFPSNNKMPTEDIHTPQDDDSDNDEPLLSGSGVVSKDVTDENLLEAWHETLVKWHQNLKQRPKSAQALCRKGVPEALRGEVWQLLGGCHENATEMNESYRILITKDSPNEQVILRDINRTFPAHDYFKQSGGLGQDSLYRISKAYSVYDEEIGYCQGLSFLAAALLLHMPEEQAFGVLVKIMFDYGLRDVFKQGFEELHLKFFQLERIMEDNLPDLFDHFLDMGLEAHMFASQWFLTLFTAKFPLFMVFHIIDVFLSEGIEVIFKVAFALLKTSKKELLTQDFEGILKYFRVSMPKKYRSEDAAKELMYIAANCKITVKKLKKYEKEYIALKEAQMQQEDPVERLQRENMVLKEAKVRLEQENDDLANELVGSKIALRNDLDQAEDKVDILNKELEQTKSCLVETEEEKKRLATETTQIKDLCRREMEKSETEATRNATIIAEYKQICSQLSERLEKQQAAHVQELASIKSQIEDCGTCSKIITSTGTFKKVEKVEPMSTANEEKDATIRNLELQLAQTKLDLVESKCKVQDLTHELNAAISEIQESKNTWFQKTITSIREVANKKEVATPIKKDPGK